MNDEDEIRDRGVSRDLYHTATPLLFTSNARHPLCAIENRPIGL
jgi:hypothetical protein